MQTVPTNITISDYCQGMERKEIAPNPDYQRSDKVWPPAARSFLIETILLGYPIPKVFLYLKTDVKSKKTIKEIVDGQQRSRAIYDFFTGKLALSRNSEIEGARGRKYEELDEELKGKFLNYAISADLFVSVSPAEIRQAFRRLNSYTVPLNPEELRHAEYQGELKWFVYQICRSFEEALLALGVLGEKSIVRMQDAKLVSECIDAFLNGIRTTNAKSLNGLYRRFEHDFPYREEVGNRFDQAFAFLIGLPEIHRGPLMVPHIFYSLLLAVSQMLQPSEKLPELDSLPAPGEFDRGIAIANLSTLAEALEQEEPNEQFVEFTKACESKTNVSAQRTTRVVWLLRALQPALF